MKKSAIPIAFMFVCSVVLGQSPQKFQWGVKAGGIGADKIAGITAVGTNLYVTGQYSGRFTSGSVSTPEGNGIFLSRLDKNGKTDWIRSITGDERNSVSRIATSDKNILIGGLITGAIKIEKELFDGKGQSVFVSLWSDMGKPLWLTRIPYTGYVTVDVLLKAPDGNYYVGGMFQGTIKSGESEWQSPFERRAFFMTLSPTGKPLKMMASQGKGSHRLVSATTASDGHFYLLYSITGDFGLGNIAPGVTPRDMDNGLVLAKITPAGEVAWLKSIFGKDYLEGFKILSLRSSDVLVCANYTQSLKINETIVQSKGGVEMALLLFSDKGEFIKSGRVVSPVAVRGMDALLVNKENILITGYFRSEYSTGKELVKSPSSLGDLFLLQTNSFLETIWHDAPGQDAASYSKSVTVDEAGNIVLAGAFKGELSLKGKKMVSEDKDDDIFIAKYCNCLLKEATIAGNPFLCSGGTTELSLKGDYQTWSWNGQSGKSALTVTKPGFYTVLAYDRIGCATSDTVEVITLPKTDLGLPDEATLYPSQPLILEAKTGFSSYQWSDGETFPSREVSFETAKNEEQLILTAVSKNGCIATDTVKLKQAANSITGSDPDNRVQVWPNPVDNLLMWSASMEDADRIAVSLFDDKGIAVYTRELKTFPAGSVQSLDMTGMASGNYILSLKAGNRSFNRKIVKK